MKRDTQEPSMSNETQGTGLHPHDTGELHMGGDHKGLEADMGRAVAHLNRQTGRGKSEDCKG